MSAAVVGIGLWLASMMGLVQFQTPGALIAAGALMIDYVLTVAVSVAAGIAALTSAAHFLWERRQEILDANSIDCDMGRDKGLSAAMQDRLVLNDARILAMVDGLRSIAEQRDPVGRVMAEWDRPNGLHIQRVATPLGVVGVISAFNFPVAVWSWNAALALVCGDSVVWKPSEKTLLTALATQAIVERAAKRIGSVGKPELQTWCGRTLANLHAERGGHISDMLAGWLIGKWTEYCTSNEYRPTQEIADQAITGPASKQNWVAIATLASVRSDQACFHFSAFITMASPPSLSITRAKTQ